MTVPHPSHDHPATRRVHFVLTALCCVVLAVVLAACGTDEGDTSGGVLARVNGEAVTQTQVDDVRAEGRLAGEEKTADAALDEAIGRALVRQEAERLGVVVQEAEVQKRLDDLKQRAGGKEALAKALAQAGMSAAQLRRGAQYGLLREKLRDERFGDLSAGDAAVRAFYRKYRDELFTEAAAVDYSSILVRTERLGDQLVEDLRAGGSFADLARTYSRDSVSRDAGGRMGWIVLDSLPEPLRQAIEGLDKGEVAGPVQGPGGWFVLKLHDRRPKEVTAFADIEGELRAELDMRKRTRALDRWIAAERKRADVERLAP